MVSKEKFLDFISIVEKTEKARQALEKGLGGYPIGDLAIFTLSNNTDKIAGFLLDEDEDYFYEDFWTMINEGKVEFQIIKGEETIDVTLSNWEEFYDYYSAIPR